MILIDTSVWIEVFRARRPLDLESVIDFDEVVTCLPVVKKVLQGFRDERAHRQARKSMLALPIVESPMDTSCSWKPSTSTARAGAADTPCARPSIA